MDRRSFERLEEALRVGWLGTKYFFYFFSIAVDMEVMPLANFWSLTA